MIYTQSTSLRDEKGLLKQGVTYAYDNIGRVNWRAMLPPQYLFVNPDYEKEVCVRQKVESKWDIDVTKVEDKQLLITLAGLKYLARLRGIKRVSVTQLHVSPTEVTSACEIEFIPNFEDPCGLTVSAQASASLYSVSGKFQLYLAAFAQNRAFTRACKDALGIEILGFEEVDFKASAAFEKNLKEGKNPLMDFAASTSAPVSDTSLDSVLEKDGHKPHDHLRQLCKEHNISFDVLKARAIEYRSELIYDQKIAAGESIDPAYDPVNWTGINKESIPQRDVWTLITKIQEAAEKKGKKAKEKK
jgi:hypothetical protein